MDITQACITIDVSKGNSHVCGYEGINQVLGNVFKIEHNKDGFKQLDELVQKLTERTGSPPIFVYETTGIYHRPLKRHLTQKGYRQAEVSPLLSAKHRKNSAIRSAKTDVRDTHSLAKLFYSLDLPLNQRTNEHFYELIQWDRYYIELTSLMVKCKVHFNEKLDILFPKIRDVFDNIYSTYFLECLKRYPHPEILVGKRVDTLDHLLLEYGIQKNRSKVIATELKAFCQTCCAGSSKDSVDSLILQSFIHQIQSYQHERTEVIKKMIEIGNQFPLFKQLQTIPGIGPILSIRLTAELGDLSRFNRSKQLIAYAGLDPVVYQSGQYEGKHLKISKKGNKALRQILFQSVDQIIKCKKLHRITLFYQKKRQTLQPKSAKIAGCDKLLRIIFSLYHSGETYQI